MVTRSVVTFFVTGATNAGKSTFLAAFKRLYPDRVHLIEVGKMMRAKYPPSHFAGQASPQHTADEAWQMFLDGVNARPTTSDIVLVDGQPRDLDQLDKIYKMYKAKESYHFDIHFLHFYASEEVRRNRAIARDGADPAKLELALARIQGDIPKLYDVLIRLLTFSPTDLNAHNTDEVDLSYYDRLVFSYVTALDTLNGDNSDA